MKYCLNLLVRCFLAIKTSLLLSSHQAEAHPQKALDYSEPKTQLTVCSEKDEQLRQRFQIAPPFRFDDILEFVDGVGEGELERFTDFQLENMCIQLVYFARQGFTSNDETEKANFENDVAELLSEFELKEGEFSYKDSFSMFPALYQEQLDSNAERKFNKTCDKKCKGLRLFCNKYNKTILIGGIVEATAVCLAYVAVDASLRAALITAKATYDPSAGHSIPSIQNNPSDLCPSYENVNFASHEPT